MAYFNEKTTIEAAPTPLPFPLSGERHMDFLATTNRTKKPSAVGLIEDVDLSLADKPRSEYVQNHYIKLFFARNFDITTAHMAQAYGMVANGPKTDIDDIEKQQAKFENFKKTSRAKIFGPSSFLTRAVHHGVAAYNFEHTMLNLQIAAMFCAAKGNEEPDEAARTEYQKQEKTWEAAYNDHRQRLQDSRQAAVDGAQQLWCDEVDKINGKRRNRYQPAAVKYARKNIEMAEKFNNTPVREFQKLGDVVKVDELHALFPYYHHSPSARQELYWEEMYDAHPEIVINMLWTVKDTIDIPATMYTAEHIFKTVWVTFACELANYECYEAEEREMSDYFKKIGTNDLDRDGGVKVNLETKNCRQKYVYPKLQSCLGDKWPNEEGLDLLQVPITVTPRPSKRESGDWGQGEASKKRARGA